MVYTPTVQLADEMRDAFLNAGVPAASVNGNTPDDERRKVIRDLRSGAISVVANAAVFTEGFDEPSLDCIIVARPTLSRVLYTQIIGRGTRLFPGKTDCLVIDMVGVTERLNLITVPNLFGVNATV
jgi:superfamily II DNA or RNA helicase